MAITCMFAGCVDAVPATLAGSPQSAFPANLVWLDSDGHSLPDGLIELGAVVPASRVERRLYLQSIGNETVQLVSFESSCECCRLVGELPSELAPGGSALLTVEIDLGTTSSFLGDLEIVAHVHTDGSGSIPLRLRLEVLQEHRSAPDVLGPSDPGTDG